MNNYKEIILERPDALRFVKKRLKYGHFLSNYILHTIDLESGYISTALPENGNTENIYNFEYGGIIPQPPESEWRRVTAKDGSKSIMVPVHTMISHLVDTIQLFLKNGNGRICIIEDDVANATDSYLKTTKTKYVTSQNTVYHLLLDGNHSKTYIKEIVRKAGSFLMVGVLTSLPLGTEIRFTKHMITESTLKDLAKRVDKIYLLAYDQESYVIWHRNELS